MEIKTKFAIGDKVYILYRTGDMKVTLMKDEIAKIVITDKGIVYYGKIMDAEFKEEEIVLINDYEHLIKKIIELAEVE